MLGLGSSAPTMPGEESCDLSSELPVLGSRSEEAAVWHGLADVELRFDTRGAQLAVHSHRVRKKEVARARFGDRSAGSR